MEPLSASEENYIKAIYQLSKADPAPVNTNSLSEFLHAKPASITDMVQKIADKGLVEYEKYKGVVLTENGRARALEIVRRQRLWKVFLVDKLKFNWNEITEVADQLEHIASSLLISRLEQFLGYPRFDPTGDPIPDDKGLQQAESRKNLNEFAIGETGILVAVSNTSTEFLKYLDKTGLNIGCKIRLLDKLEFDGSMEIQVDDRKNLTITKDAGINLELTA
jgi:DtxR family transcriptional regulator, Mn-dependent transcriptional regulator